MRFDFDNANWAYFSDPYGSNGYMAHDDDTDRLLVVFFDADVFHCNGGLGYSWKIYDDSDVPDIGLLVSNRDALAHGEWFDDMSEAMGNLVEWYQKYDSSR